jgi:hypothetical protein
MWLWLILWEALFCMKLLCVVDMSWVCDGTSQCPDNHDEKNCCEFQCLSNGYAFHILLFVMVITTVQMAVMRQLQNVQEVCVYVCSYNTYSETTMDNVWMLERWNGCTLSWLSHGVVEPVLQWWWCVEVECIVRVLEECAVSIFMVNCAVTTKQDLHRQEGWCVNGEDVK